jgi:hypothetical protein
METPSSELNFSPESPVMAIDPGKTKCGLAILESSGNVLYAEVVGTQDLLTSAQNLIDQYHPLALIVGNGTGCSGILTECSKLRSLLPVHQVEEHHTSELARKRYCVDHPPKGLRKLIPPSLRFPDSPYDHYVAIILAERWLGIST